MNGIPTMLGGRYEVGDLIGRGGMAEVHLGFDGRLGRTVAIKLLRSDLARDQSFINRFRREAQAAAGLNHPSVVAVYDTDEERMVESGGATVAMPYIVMEYVDGTTLREYLNHRGHLDPDEAALITEGVLDALAYSHRAGIVHRDIKPANVMIGGNGEVKVMDFGIARAVADANATMTQTQAVMGTAQYLSPEQAQGQHVDARSDIYSTGCMLFELLTGRAPFVGDTLVSVAYQHVGQNPPRPSALVPGIPPAYDAIVAHALVKDRDSRYQTADAFRADLEAARHGRQISAAALGSAALLGSTATEVLPGVGTTADPTAVYSPAPASGGNGDLGGIGTEVDEEPRRRRGAYVGLVLAVLAVLGGLGWGMKTYLGNQHTVTQVKVPDLKNKSDADAKTLLAQASLKGQANPIPDPTVKKGYVISQVQQPGVLVDPGSTITYDVSTGPDSQAIPNVAGMTADKATAALTAAGFKVSTDPTAVDNSTQKKDLVDSTVPPIGEVVAPGSTITLRLSSGKLTVPDVRGKKQGDAYFILTQAGFKVTVTFADSTDTPGNVIDQNPVGTLLDRDGTVAITVARPPATTTTTTPPATTTTTTSPPPTP